MKDIDLNGFEQMAASGAIVLDFYTTLCSPCKQMAPIIEEVEAKRPDIAFFKVNAQESPDLAARFSIRTVPTFLVLNSGMVKGQKGGTMSSAQMQTWIDDCLR